MQGAALKALDTVRQACLPKKSWSAIVTLVVLSPARPGGVQEFSNDAIGRIRQGCVRETHCPG